MLSEEATAQLHRTREAVDKALSASTLPGAEDEVVTRWVLVIETESETDTWLSRVSSAGMPAWVRHGMLEHGKGEFAEDHVEYDE
jgi:hypothetical protein